MHDAHWYPDNEVELVLGTRVTRLDPKAHTVTLDGVETVRYDKLLLATGSRVRRLDLPGSDNPGIRYLRTITESDAILSDLREGANVVVLGAGWIGMEVAAAARTHGASVHLVERGDLPLKRVLGPELARIYANLHVARGVTFHANSGVREFGGVGGRLSHVILGDGTELPADLVVTGRRYRAGHRARRSRWSAGRRWRSHGRVAAHLGLRHLRRRRCSVLRQPTAGPADPGRTLGQRAQRRQECGQIHARPGHGVRLAAVLLLRPVRGHTEHQHGVRRLSSDRTATTRWSCGAIRRSSHDANPEFVAFWVRNGQVLAGMNANVWDVQEQIQPLVRVGLRGPASGSRETRRSRRAARRPAHRYARNKPAEIAAELATVDGRDMVHRRVVHR